MQKTSGCIFRKVLIVTITLTLFGCASPAERQAYARRMGDQELCMSWMATPSMNQYYGALQGEIRRRGLNCYQYGNVAAEQRKAENRLNEAIRCAAGCSPAPVNTQQREVIYERQAPMGPGVIRPGPTPYGR